MGVVDYSRCIVVGKYLTKIGIKYHEPVRTIIK